MSPTQPAPFIFSLFLHAPSKSFRTRFLSLHSQSCPWRDQNGPSSSRSRDSYRTSCSRLLTFGFHGSSKKRKPLRSSALAQNAHSEEPFCNAGGSSSGNQDWSLLPHCILGRQAWSIFLLLSLILPRSSILGKLDGRTSARLASLI